MADILQLRLRPNPLYFSGHIFGAPVMYLFHLVWKQFYIPCLVELEGTVCQVLYILILPDGNAQMQFA